jgi:hypothetical protein
MTSKAVPTCSLCETRRPRRFCPAIRAEICPPCCGASREITIDCPLDCPHLEVAHHHERPPEPDTDKLPNPDIELSRDFLSRNTPLLDFLTRALLRHVERSPNLNDNDVRETLDALARTYRTLQAGLYYETQPSNPYAAELAKLLRRDIDQFIQELRAGSGLTTVRDADVLGVLVFLQRVEFFNNNGRPRGKAFLSLLRRQFGSPASPGETQHSRLVLPS